MQGFLVEDARSCTGRNLERQRPGGVSSVLRMLLPRRCAACGAPAPVALCEICALDVARPEPGAPARAAFAYAGAVRAALRRAKFRRDAGALHALLPGACARLAPPGEADAVCFVPLHPRRLLARGFDPAAVVAVALARTWGLPLVANALRCGRHDPPLSHGADAARRARQVAGRYRAGAGVAGARLVVVDDVVTTGATLREAARALRRAGAEPVERVALAATP